MAFDRRTLPGHCLFLTHLIYHPTIVHEQWRPELPRSKGPSPAQVNLSNCLITRPDIWLLLLHISTPTHQPRTSLYGTYRRVATLGNHCFESDLCRRLRRVPTTESLEGQLNPFIVQLWKLTGLCRAQPGSPNLSSMSPILTHLTRLK